MDEKTSAKPFEGDDIERMATENRSQSANGAGSFGQLMSGSPAMESLNIRATALRMAGAGEGQFLGADDLIARARAYERYLRGESTAPATSGDPFAGPVPDGRPLYQLYREDLEVLRAVVNGTHDSDPGRALAIIDDAIAERERLGTATAQAEPA